MGRRSPTLCRSHLVRYVASLPSLAFTACVVLLSHAATSWLTCRQGRRAQLYSYPALAMEREQIMCSSLSTLAISSGTRLHRPGLHCLPTRCSTQPPPLALSRACVVMDETR